MKTQRQLNAIYVLLAGLVIFVLILAIAMGGISGGGTPPQSPSTNTPNVTDYQPVIPDTTKVLSASTTQNISSISQDGMTYIFSQTTDELTNVKVGDVVVSDASSHAPNGFLRRVTNITNNNGQVILETKQASLDEAIQNGTIKLHRKLTSADIARIEILEQGHAKFAAPQQAQNGFFIEKNDIIVYDKDGDQNTQLDQVRMKLKYEFEPDLVFEASIHNFTLEEMRFEIEITQTKTMEFEYGLKQDFEKVDGNNINVEIARYYLNPITIYAGIPVVLVPIISVVAGLDGDVHAGVVMELTQTETSKNGLAYSQQDGWQNISEQTQKFGFFPPNLVPDVGWKIQGYVGPRLTLMLYGVVGPYSGLRFYLEWEHNGFGSSSWYAGLGVDVGVKMETFSHKLVDKSEKFAGYRVLLNPPATTNTPPVVPVITTTPSPPGSPPREYSNSSTIMLFDISGSMNEEDVTDITKLDAAKGAGARILDIIEAENSASQGADVGILSFSYSAWVNSALSTDVGSARSALGGLYANGGTGMPDGLRLSIDQLQNTQQDSKPIIILLSDGVPNIGLGGTEFLDESEVRQQVLDLASEAGSKEICIYTVGFGVPNTIGNVSGEASIDEEFLKQVSANSGCGAYYNAQNATELANVYVNLRHESTGSVVLQKTGNISQGETVELGVANVTQGANEMLFTLNWPGSRLDPSLVDPSGKIVDQNYPGAHFFQTNSLASVIISNPAAGNWKFTALGAEVPEGIIGYNAVVSVRTNTGNVVVPTSGSVPAALVIVPLLIGGLLTYMVVVSSKRGRTQHSRAVSAARLYVTVGQGVGRTISLRDNLIIGRSRISNIYIADPSVSRRHARIRFSNGQWFIQDMGSSSGIYVNGAKLNASVLMSGDQIRIGKTKFEFRQ